MNANDSPDPRVVLNDIADIIDRQPDRSRVQVTPLATALFPSLESYERYLEIMTQAEKSGAVKISWDGGRHAPKRSIKKIALANADALFSFLGRTPLISSVGETLDRLSLPDGLDNVILDLGGKWGRNLPWYGIPVGDGESVERASFLAQSILERDWSDPIDMRTFSRRACGDSKALVTLYNAVTTIIRIASAEELQGIPDDELFLNYGIHRLPHPILVSGQSLLANSISFSSFSYVGIPHDVELRSAIPNPVVVTIENLASFHLFARQFFHRQPEMVCIYTGGWPSRNTLRILSEFAKTVPQASFFHWGDIDPSGAAIGDILWRRVSRNYQPLQMSTELAEIRGEPLKKRKAFRILAG